MPTVSVIIPNYNHAPYLTQRIESVLNQTYQDFEVIILDDKSTDNSRDIIEQYRNHPKVSHIIYNEENSGSTFKQWKKGIELAKGEWIWIAESDDWCEPVFLENLVSLTNKYPSAGLAYCQSLLYNEAQNTISPATSISKIEDFISKEHYLSEKLIPFCSLINASMAIFRKELYHLVSPEYKNYRLAGDWIFWAEISQQADVIISGKYHNYFRQHDIKVSMNSLKEGSNYPEELKALAYFKTHFSIPEEHYNNAIIKHYMRFKYSKFPFNPGIVEKTELLFRNSFNPEVEKKIKKETLKNRLLYRTIPKYLNLFFK